MSRLTYPLESGGRGVDCPICAQAVRVERHGRRLSVRCYAGCPETEVLAALDVGAVLDDLAADQGGSSTPRVLRELDVARMVSEPPPPVPWVVEGLVMRGGLTALSGQPGASKSLLCLALAAAVATGTSEVGFACERGDVLIIDAENGQAEIHRRVHRLGVPAHGVRVVEADGFDLRERDHQRQLEALLIDRPALLVLDSFRTLWGGQENDSGETTAVLQPLRAMLRRHGVGAIMPVHVGRENRAYRGSEAFAATLELGFKLASAEGDPDPQRRFLECWKARPCEKPAKRWLRFGFEADVLALDQADPYGEKAPPGRPARASETLRPRLEEALADGPLSQAEIARRVDRSPSDNTVRRLLRALEAEGVAGRSADGRWSVARIARSATAPPAPVGGGVMASDDLAIPLATPEEAAEAERVLAKFGPQGAAS